LLPEPTPAAGSILCLVCGPLGGVSTILNLFLFAPLGIGLALSGIPRKRALLSMFALSVLIETAQYFLIPGRYATIGDVLTNSLGGALGFGIGRYATALLRPPSRVATALGLAWSALWLAIQTVSAFGFAPAFPKSEYYGEIAPRLGGFEQFPGVVVRASIADVPLPDARFSDSRKVRELLLHGASVATTIVSQGPTSDLAPIVRVADAREREIVLLAQNADNLVFGVRTGAAVLRLRPPFFALRGALPAVRPAENGATMATLMVSARYSTREVLLNTQTSASHDRRIPITASLGWTLLWPFQWFIEGTGTERVLSALWVACLLLPVGYWAGHVVRSSRASSNRMIAVPVVLLLLYVGLVAVPEAFGVNPAPIRDWLAAFTGTLVGSAMCLVPRAFAGTGSPMNSGPIERTNEV
jgi:VanZ family protein